MLRFENVGLRYGMGPEVLGDLDFSVEPQSFQFLTGPSGAGKTTLMRLMLLALRSLPAFDRALLALATLGLSFAFSGRRRTGEDLDGGREAAAIDEHHERE